MALKTAGQYEVDLHGDGPTGMSTPLVHIFQKCITCGAMPIAGPRYLSSGGSRCSHCYRQRPVGQRASDRWAVPPERFISGLRAKPTGFVDMDARCDGCSGCSGYRFDRVDSQETYCYKLCGCCWIEAVGRGLKFRLFDHAQYEDQVSDSSNKCDPRADAAVSEYVFSHADSKTDDFDVDSGSLGPTIASVVGHAREEADTSRSQEAFVPTGKNNSDVDSLCAEADAVYFDASEKSETGKPQQTVILTADTSSSENEDEDVEGLYVGPSEKVDTGKSHQATESSNIPHENEDADLQCGQIDVRMFEPVVLVEDHFVNDRLSQAFESAQADTVSDSNENEDEEFPDFEILDAGYG